ncbi:hypothetical protein D3C81_723250 [compost metagenome]
MSSPSCRAWLTTWMAMIESPPRAKKLSCIPTWGRFSTVSQIDASCCSSAVRGATYTCLAALKSGAGKRLRANLPLAVTGKLASSIRCAGTM